MIISKALYEVINSTHISLEQKQNAIRMFAKPITNYDKGYIETSEITEEDAELICEALRQGEVIDLIPPVSDANKGTSKESNLTNLGGNKK